MQPFSVFYALPFFVCGFFTKERAEGSSQKNTGLSTPRLGAGVS